MGYAITGIDAKGRVAIPACLRGTIEANGDSRTITLARHPNAPCLIGYDRGWTLHIRAQIASEAAEGLGPTSVVERDNIKRKAYGMVEEVPFDASGRFILQGFLRHRAELEDLAFFYGFGDTFEIWSPKVLLETPEIDEDAKEFVRWELARRARS